MAELTRNQVKTKEDARKYAFQRAEKEIKELREIEKELENKDIEEIEDIREPLAISKTYRLTIELSTGGDADGFILEYNEYKELTNGFYYWADWGQYEEVPLSIDEAELVEKIYLGGDSESYLNPY